MKEQLQQLGFEGHEADIYLALLGVGETKVGDIIDKTGLHREQVYEALKRLERKGYARSFTKQKIRHYRAESPDVILQKITNLEKIATDIVPNLKKRFKETPQIVRVLEGAEGYKYIFDDQLERMKGNDEILVIGAAGEAWCNVTKDFYEPYAKKRAENDIWLKMVTFQGQTKGSWQDPNVDQSHQEVKVLPWKFDAPSDTTVYLDTIVIQISSDAPLSIMIQNEKVAKAYKNYFDILWQMAK